MKQKDFDFKGDSRLFQRSKRRKTNLILNGLIALVLLLIIIVSITIFFGGSDESGSPKEDSKNIESKENNQTNQEDSNVDNGEDESENSTAEEEVDEDSNSESDSDTGTGTDETSTEDETESEAVITEGGSDPNVKAIITNPEWTPVGTTQTGEHATVYDQNSTDWQEMIQAISYATGVEQSDMTVWFLGRHNESGSQSIGTISSKDQSKIYRVVIEWVDGQGWKPIKTEELIENDRR